MLPQSWECLSSGALTWPVILSFTSHHSYSDLYHCWSSTKTLAIYMSYSDFFHVVFLLFKKRWLLTFFKLYTIVNVFCQSCSELMFPWMRLYTVWKLIFLWCNMRAELSLILIHSNSDLFDTVCGWPFYRCKFVSCILYLCISSGFSQDRSNGKCCLWQKIFKMLKLVPVSDLYFPQNEVTIIIKQSPIKLLALPYIPNLKL